MNNQSALWLYTRVIQYKKPHYAISMWQIPTPKIFFLPRSFTFSPEFRPERNKVRWSLFHSLKDIMEDSFAKQNISAK